MGHQTGRDLLPASKVLHTLKKWQGLSPLFLDDIMQLFEQLTSGAALVSRHRSCRNMYASRQSLAHTAALHTLPLQHLGTHMLPGYTSNL